MFEKNNPTIALKILYVKEKEIFPAYILKINSNCEKEIKKFKSHEKICQNKDFCKVVMPSERNNILEFNQYMKSDKMPYIMLILNL